MNCPKCNAQGQQGNTICSSCGIVFEKYFKYNPPDDILPHDDMQQPQSIDSELVFTIEEQKNRFVLIKERIFYIADNEDPISISGRSLVLLGMIYLSFKLVTSSIASNYAGEIFLHAINLPFHEAGHVIFGFLGSFMTSLGGTLGQLIVPAVFCYSFIYKMNNPFAGAVCFWWFGENFIDIAPYINDARDGNLPLIGGNFGHSSPYGFHDWEYILNESGLLQYDKIIAKISFLTGTIIMLVALLWCSYLVYMQIKVTKI